MKQYVIVLEQSNTGWSGYSPDLPVIAAGDTRVEALKLMREGIQYHLDWLREDNLPIPEPATEVFEAA
jgi:predicted RNase H-like HicB family nuclease